MDAKEISKRIRDGEPITEVLSPEHYVFNEQEIKEYFLMKGRGRKKRPVTKTQLRKYFNEFKSLQNYVSTNPQISKEEFNDLLKRVLIVIPILKSQHTFPEHLTKLIEHALELIYNKAKKDHHNAIEDYQAFIDFYETLIAYSRD